MSTQGPLPYLEFCGVEVGNAARTVEYLRAGLADGAQGHWTVGPSEPCSVLYRVDVNPAPGGYGAFYFGQPWFGDGRIVDDESLAPPSVSARAPFVGPAADPAPWYDPSEPGSARFLGFVPLGISGYDSTVSRQVTARIHGLGGGTFAALRRQPRVWKFRGALVSADDSGAEYGLRWLQHVLAASPCDGCGTCWLAVRLVCPPDDGSNDELGLWYSYDVGLVDGPHEVDQRGPSATAGLQDTLGGCRDFVIVEFTIEAGNPFLYKPPTACLSGAAIEG